MKSLFTKYLVAFAALVVIFESHAAEEITFEASAPMLVAVGETFRAEFVFNAKPEDDSFQPPAFEGFDILAGPALSRGSSIQIVNGAMTKSTSYTYTFVLVASEAGQRTIPAAKILCDGKSYSTKPLPIEVVAEGEKRAASSSADRGSSIAPDDILLRLTLSRESLFKGEALRATLKLYYRVPIAGAESEKLPTFQGFWAQQINNNARAVTSRETYNGKVYETQVLRDYLLYPQQSGIIEIEPAEMDLLAQVTVRSRNIDPFFGGGMESYNVRRHVSTEPIKVDVKALPTGAPASFNGAVGSFSLDVTPPSDRVVANSSSSYRVRISGSGNISFVQAPSLSLPNSFEQYNVKSTESINSTERGASGYKEFEYPFIARSEGEYEIPAVEFSFFNPETMSYQTLSSKGVEMTILPDKEESSVSRGVQLASRGMSKEEVKLLGEDIRFIKIGEARLERAVRPFILSPIYFVWLAVVVAMAVALYIIISRQIRDSKNSALLRGKRASKVAVQRLRRAKVYIAESNERAFYEEMLRALWGYMGDKLNIPVALLTKESVREQLQRRGVASEQVAAFSSLLERCDEAQYSPMASAQMGEVYGSGLELLSQIESMIKK
ncbi:MAG: BatD family protein [Rikenellaceae bacterium]